MIFRDPSSIRLREGEETVTLSLDESSAPTDEAIEDIAVLVADSSDPYLDHLPSVLSRHWGFWEEATEL